MITIACVRVGRRYSFDYVRRLRRMVERHSNMPFRFVCLSDQPEQEPGIRLIDIGGAGLPGWWAKMLLFRRDVRDLWDKDPVFYFDLDTVICGPLAPLLEMTFDPHDQHPFAICENWTRRHGNKTWPCRYGSCVMVFGERYGNRAWSEFNKGRRRLIDENETYGDQRVIEILEPCARLLQDWTPTGFMISYRAIPPRPSPELSVINFGGSHKPDNCTIEWVREAWLA